MNMKKLRSQGNDEDQEGQGRGRHDGGKNGRKEARPQKGALTHGLADLGEMIHGLAQARTIVDEAQSLQCETKFTNFIFQGNGSTLFVPDNAGGRVIFKYVVNSEHLAFEVLHSEDPKLPAGFVFVARALEDFAASGMDH